MRLKNNGLLRLISIFFFFFISKFGWDFFPDKRFMRLLFKVNDHTQVQSILRYGTINHPLSSSSAYTFINIKIIVLIQNLPVKFTALVQKIPSQWIIIQYASQAYVVLSQWLTSHITFINRLSTNFTLHLNQRREKVQQQQRQLHLWAIILVIYA